MPPIGFRCMALSMQMAKKQITQLIDDLDGEIIDEGGKTLHFSLEGRAYEIDLSDENAQKLRDALEPFITAGRAIGATERASAPSRGRRARTTGDLDLSAVREWARSNGHTVSERGRVPAAVLEAYRAAH